MTMFRRFGVYACLCLLAANIHSLKAQVVIDNSLTPTQLVQQVLLGNGVSVSNITFNGQSGDILSGQIARYAGPSAVIEFPEAVVMRSGHTQPIADPFFPVPFPYPILPISNDPDLQAISNIQSVNDCAILEFDFVPNGDSLVFRYVFASIEYPGFTCSGFNDAFGFFLSGPGLVGPFTNNAVNIALIPNSNTPVAVNTINSGMASNPGSEANCFNANPNWVADAVYFVDNGLQPAGDVQFPGMTVTLTAYAQVICGQEYHIKLAIADASDSALDSGVFLEAGSFTSNSVVQVNLDIPVGVNDSTLYEGCGEATLQFIRPLSSAGIQETAYLAISGTGLNGIDFIPALPDSIIFPAGIDTVSFVLTAPNDPNFEGIETVTVTITNIASNCSGAILTSDFTFYINEDDPLVVTGFNGALVDCNDDILLFPTITGGYGEYTYTWSTGQTADSITVSPGFTTTIFLLVGDTCGLASVQTTFGIEVPTYPPVQVDLGPDFVIDECDVTVNLSAAVSGGFGTYDYSWRESGVQIGMMPTLNYFVANSTTVTLIVSDDCDAIGTDDVMITVPPVEVSVLLPDVFEASSCLEGFMLPVISEGGIGIKIYTWIVDGVEQAETTLPFFDYHPSMGQNVQMIAEDECQNIGTDSTVIAFNFPEVQFNLAPSDTSICLDTEAILRVNALSGSGGYKVLWNNAFLGEDYLVKPLETRRYNVVVTDTCGMSASGSALVNVREVRADFDSDDFGYYGVTLTNFSRAVNPTYLWDFGDGETSTDADPVHEYNDVQNHTILLTTTDDIGCQDIATLNTIPPIEVYIPNSFTPNGDGINDLFGAKGINVFEFEMWIFDRWGKQVFYTDDIDKKWNGSTNANDYYTSTTWYTYSVRYKGTREEDAVELTGIITMVR